MKQQLTILMVLAGIAMSAHGQDEQLGRLFTTPSERARLDLARKQGGFTVAPEAKPEEISEQVTLNGYVIRSNGKTTTWLNQLPEQTRSTVLVTQKPGQAPVISIKTDIGKRVRVDVGDSVDMQTGAVRPLLETH